VTTKEQSKKFFCYPAKKLIELWPPNTTASLLAEVFGVTRTTIVRWRNNEDAALTIWQADKYAIKIGMHPQEIWTDWYDKQ
jgi:hypothetical protein